MTGHTYLSKSRHGVYYFRAVLPKGVRARVGRREVRISLRTNDRAQAKVLLKALTITKSLSHFEPWELEECERLERYQRGLALIEKSGLSAGSRRIDCLFWEYDRTGRGLTPAAAYDPKRSSTKFAEHDASWQIAGLNRS